MEDEDFNPICSQCGRLIKKLEEYYKIQDMADLEDGSSVIHFEIFVHNKCVQVDFNMKILEWEKKEKQ